MQIILNSILIQCVALDIGGVLHLHQDFIHLLLGCFNTEFLAPGLHGRQTTVLPSHLQATLPDHFRAIWDGSGLPVSIPGRYDPRLDVGEAITQNTRLVGTQWQFSPPRICRSGASSWCRSQIHVIHRLQGHCQVFVGGVASCSPVAATVVSATSWPAASQRWYWPHPDQSHHGNGFPGFIHRSRILLTRYGTVCGARPKVSTTARASMCPCSATCMTRSRANPSRARVS